VLCENFFQKGGPQTGGRGGKGATQGGLSGGRGKKFWRSGPTKKNVGENGGGVRRDQKTKKIKKTTMSVPGEGLVALLKFAGPCAFAGGAKRGPRLFLPTAGGFFIVFAWGGGDFSTAVGENIPPQKTPGGQSPGPRVGAGRGAGGREPISFLKKKKSGRPSGGGENPPGAV